DLIALGLFVIMPLIVVRQSHALWTAPVTIIGFLWLAILAHGVILGIVSSFDILGHVSMPTEMWQYVKRMLFFFAAFAAARASDRSSFTAYRIIFFAALAAVLIGIIQIP